MKIKFYKRFKYKLFLIWKKNQYRKFLSKQDDYDYGSLIDLIIFKLTMMGIQFFNWSILDKEEKRKQIHSIWKTRYFFKKIEQSFDIAYSVAENKFLEKYGVPYIFDDFVCKDIGNDEVEMVGFSLKSPCCSTFEEAQRITSDFYSMMPNEYKLKEKFLNEALNVMKKNIFSWWI